MQAFLSQLGSVPEYAMQLAHSMLIPTIITAVVFLIALIFTGKFPYFLRAVYVVAAILMIGYGIFFKNYALVWIMGISLVIMIIVRLIIHIVRTVHENRRIALIERKALERSAKKRGSWKNKQGYSGDVKPIVAEEYKPEAMTRDEIKDVVENDTMNLPVDEILANESASEGIKAEDVKAAYEEAMSEEPAEADAAGEAEAVDPDTPTGDTKPFNL